MRAKDHHLQRELRQADYRLHPTIVVKESQVTYGSYSQIMSFIFKMWIYASIILLDNLLRYLMFIAVIDLFRTCDSIANLIYNALVMFMIYYWIKIKLKVLIYPTSSPKMSNWSSKKGNSNNSINDATTPTITRATLAAPWRSTTWICIQYNMDRCTTVSVRSMNLVDPVHIFSRTKVNQKMQGKSRKHKYLQLSIWALFYLCLYKPLMFSLINF
jgi:hypothetical protein